MDNYIIVKVKTGTRSQYIFKRPAVTTTHPVITVETGPDTEDARLSDYCVFEGKGATAIQRLMERVAELEQFVEDVEMLAVTDYHTGRLTQFLEREDVEEEHDDAYERVAEVIERRRREEDRKAGISSLVGRWVKDEDDD